MKKAFTLAEVLITLGIIGIVAAMTLPAVIQKNTEKETVTKLKKFNSTMNQAFMMAKNEHGEIENWGLSTAGMSEEPSEDELINHNATRNKFLQIMTKYLKVTRICKQGENECKKYTRYSLDGTIFQTFAPMIILNDGMSIVGINVTSGSCSSNFGTSSQLQHVCGEIFVDLNGPKPPNKTGKDVFLFYYTKYGFIPIGMEAETRFSFKKDCNMSNKSNLNGYGCTAWVIYNENMDYTRCNNLSWDGKLKCK